MAIDLFGVDAVIGWVRTGDNNALSGTAGEANCMGWTNPFSRASGTVANLPSGWIAGEQDVGLWNADLRACNFSLPVWCVQDDSLWKNYLPVLLK